MLNLRIKELRKMLNKNQDELAEMLGVKVRTYGSWERGEAQMNIEQAYKLSRVLDCTIDDLIVKDEPVEPRLTPDEKSLIDTYRGLDKSDRSVTIRVMSALNDTGQGSK